MVLDRHDDGGLAVAVRSGLGRDPGGAARRSRAAFSSRLAMTRSNRRLSTLKMVSSSTGSIQTTGGGSDSGIVRVPAADRLAHQLAGVDVLERHVGRPGVGTGDLEQLGDHALEAPEVGPEELEGPLRPRA